MGIKNSANQYFSNNADGFTFGGGTTLRTLAVTGGAATITASGSATVTFPSSTSTLATLALSEELTNKTLTSSVGKGTWTASGTWTLPAVTAGGLITVNAGSSYAVTTANTGIQMTLSGANDTTPIALTINSSSASGNALTITNLTNFAHAGDMVKFTFANATDSGKLLVLSNAGSGAALDITQKDSTTAVSIKINATQANVTAADTFIAFKSTTGTEGDISGTAGAGVLIFNTFTGSHWTKTEDKAEIYELLEVTEGKPNINNKDHLFSTKVSQTRASKRAIGFYGGRNKEGNDNAMSLGTGYALVANKGKDVEIGDFLISSDVKGCVELQDDDIYRNITVAKATENITWNGEDKKKISVIYLGG